MDASPKSNPEPLPNPADYAGNTPLHDAASAGDLAALTALLRGRHPDAQRDCAGLTPLHVAAIHGQIAALETLLAAGADPATRDKADTTPLVAAARHDHVAVIDLLVAHGADVNTANNFGVTALHVAALNHKLAAATRLLHHGANANAALGGELPGVTPLALTQHPALRKALGQHGATEVAGQRFDDQRLCPVCGIELVTERNLTVLHGNLFAPTHDTELEITFACRVCATTFTTDGYGSGVMGNSEHTYIFVDQHQVWISDIDF